MKFLLAFVIHLIQMMFYLHFTNVAQPHHQKDVLMVTCTIIERQWILMNNKRAKNSKPLNRDIQNPPFLTFLIILIMTKIPASTFLVCPWVYGLYKCIICGIVPSRHPKSCKNLVIWHSLPSWSSWLWPEILKHFLSMPMAPRTL